MQELNISPVYCNTNWFEPSWKPISNKDLLAFLPLCMTAGEDSIETHILKHSVENNIQSKSSYWWLKAHPGSCRLGSGDPCQWEQPPGCVGENHLGGRWCKVVCGGQKLTVNAEEEDELMSVSSRHVCDLGCQVEPRGTCQRIQMSSLAGTTRAKIRARNQILLGKAERRQNKTFVQFVFSSLSSDAGTFPVLLHGEFCNLFLLREAHFGRSRVDSSRGPVLMLSNTKSNVAEFHIWSLLAFFSFLQRKKNSLSRSEILAAVSVQCLKKREKQRLRSEPSTSSKCKAMAWWR